MHAEECRSPASAAAWHKTLATFKLTDLLDLDRRYVPLSLSSKFIKSLDNGTQEPPHTTQIKDGKMERFGLRVALALISGQGKLALSDICAQYENPNNFEKALCAFAAFLCNTYTFLKFLLTIPFKN